MLILKVKVYVNRLCGLTTKSFAKGPPRAKTLHQCNGMCTVHKTAGDINYVFDTTTNASYGSEEWPV